jgi:predicted CDP-diglyceride synthetase/phosphatidate cytidylyltransferase
VIALFGPWQYLLLFLLYVAPTVALLVQGDTGTLVFLGSAVGVLAIFSVLCRVAALKQMRGYQELIDRTKTWYWMVGVFLVAVAFHRGISFASLALLSFLAL